MGAGGKRGLRATAGRDGRHAGSGLAADGSAEREQWCLDNWDTVAAHIGAAQNVSAGVASHQLWVAQALRERLPRVAEVFSTGAITYRMVCAMVARTKLIVDGAALAKVDAELAAHVTGWGSLSGAKTQTAIDYWVDRYDPGALRRSASKSRDRHVEVVAAEDGSGLASIEGILYAHDGAVLDARLAALAATVCENDPRTRDQRRSDALAALAALGAGAERLTCGCGADDCPAAGQGGPRTEVVIHLIAEHDSLTDDTAARFDGDQAPAPPARHRPTSPTPRRRGHRRPPRRLPDGPNRDRSMRSPCGSRPSVRRWPRAPHPRPVRRPRPRR